MTLWLPQETIKSLCKHQRNWQDVLKRDFSLSEAGNPAVGAVGRIAWEAGKAIKADQGSKDLGLLGIQSRKAQLSEKEAAPTANPEIHILFILAGEV